MSQSGQQHPKADSGGQRPADPKKSNEKASDQKGAAKEAMDVGKSGGLAGAKDAKK